MGIGSALVDRARVVQKVATGQQVEGTSVLVPVKHAWFRARLFLPAESGDRPDAEQGGRRRVLRTPQLLTGIRDVDGNLIELRADVEVEVESLEQGGVFRWRVNGAPQPIRKKRPVIGYLANLERVEEPRMEALS